MEINRFYSLHGACETTIRAVGERMKIAKNREYTVNMGDGTYESQKIGASIEADLDVLGPVSYTHLDVYKRQVLHHAVGRC